MLLLCDIFISVCLFVSMQIYLFVIPFFVWVVVQVVKLCIDFFETKKFSYSLLRASGWFPSVHSALSSSVSTLIALDQGISSPIFTVSLVFSFLFWYDAMNHRYESGKHAHYINTMRLELQTVLMNKPWSFSRLKERIGHTWFEVLGGIIAGVLLTWMMYIFVWWG